MQIREDLKDLNNKSNSFDLEDIYRTLHAIVGEFTFF